MRGLLRYFFVFCALSTAAWMVAQTTPLPPGTSTPDDSARGAKSRDAALLSQAEDDIAHAEYGKALPLLNDLISSSNAQTTARALYDRGYIEQKQHDMAAAAADFRKANDANPKQFESHAALGRLLAQQAQWKDARHEFEIAATLSPASGDASRALANVERALARVDVQLRDTAAASDALMAALKLTPEQINDTLLAAKLAADAGNMADAASEYKKALTADPKSIPAAEGLARALDRQKRFADAEPVLRQSLQRNPNDPVLLAELATALAGMGKTESAIAQLETLHRRNPSQAAVTRMLADMYSGAGEPTKADPLYRQLVDADPQDADLLTAAGGNFILERRWMEATQTFEKSLNIQPAQADAWSGLAFAAFQNGQYALVLTALDHRRQYATDGAATLFLRATALDHLHRTGEALDCYRKFLSESHGKFPDEEAQARLRIKALER